MAGLFSAATFRTIGSAATPQNLFSIENIDSTKLVYVRRLLVQMDALAALTAVMPLIKTSRATAVPTGGTVLNKGVFDTANASNANTICRGSTATDGGALSGPTATAGDVLWQQYGMREHTQVGQILAPDFDQLPILVDTRNFVLRQNQALLVQVVAAIGTSNPATNHYFVQVVWEED
jgi:hypothetical protein